MWSCKRLVIARNLAGFVSAANSLEDFAMPLANGLQLEDEASVGHGERTRLPKLLDRSIQTQRSHRTQYFGGGSEAQIEFK